MNVFLIYSWNVTQFILFEDLKRWKVFQGLLHVFGFKNDYKMQFSTLFWLHVII